MVKKILMVCLGNICRSPIAEAVMQHKIYKAGLADNWKVDSAAIADYNVGCSANPRSLSVMKKHGLRYSNRARQIQSNDFNDFDYIFGMDEKNLNDLKCLAPKNSKATILLLGDFGLSKTDRIVEDPYFQRSDSAFEKVYEQCEIACEAFINLVLEGKVE